MPVHVALVRAINVGGRNTLAMSDLRELVESLGLTDARSFLQSGNLIFNSPRLKADALERLLEAETAHRLKVSADYLIRTTAELQAIIAQNPFPNEAERDPSHFVVMFLKHAPGKKSMKALQDAVRGPEIVRLDGKQLYIVYPAGIGRSRLTSALIEQKLGTRGTGRNWNTVLKLTALTRT
jgi:uncharacterized protein (DUF1697 family)